MSITHDGEIKDGVTTDHLIEMQAKFDFGLALELLKDGHKLTRAGWNGKGMWLTHISGGTFEREEENYEALPYIAMKTAQDAIVPWLASQTDLLAEDWIVIE